ncbi:unnamed protein product [Heterobilharzia americana]|nr:unnamed protein product [Heterobilharzia americana]
MIKEFLSKVINKLVHFSYTLSLIQYHFDITTSKLSTDCLTQHNKSKNHDKIDGNIIITSSLSNGYPSSKLPYIPDASLSIIGAVQLLILILCLITIPYKNYYDYNNGKCCKQNADNLYHSMCSTSSSSKHTYYSSRVTPIIDTGGEVTTATATAVSSSRSISSSSSIQANWLPNDLNCKTIPTLGLFYLDNEEENYTRRTLSTSLSSVSLSTSFTLSYFIILPRI